MEQPLVRESRIGRGHRHQCHFARPKRQRGHARHTAHSHAPRLIHGFGDADLLEHADRGPVARCAERRAYRHRRRERMFVLGNPRALQRVDRLVEMRDQRRRRVAVLERRRIDERLERGSRLAQRLCRAVEAARLEVAASNHRAHLAGCRVHRDERRLEPLAVGRWAASAAARFDLRDRCFDDGFGGALHLWIDRRIHAQAGLREPLPAELLDELLPDFFLEVLAERLLAAQDVAQRDLLVHRAIERLGRDQFLRVHRVQHEPAARQGARQAHRRRIDRRRVDDPDQQRRFSQIQLGGRLAEVAAGGCLSAIQPVAEIDLIQIQLEDFFLRIQPFDADRQRDFLELSPVLFFPGEKTLPGQLLGDGAASLGHAAVAEVCPGGPHDSPGVVPSMVLKPLILERDNGLAEVSGHARQRNFDSVFPEDRENRTVMDVVESCRLRHLPQASELFPPGKTGEKPGHEEHYSKAERPCPPQQRALVA